MSKSKNILSIVVILFFLFIAFGSGDDKNSNSSTQNSDNNTSTDSTQNSSDGKVEKKKIGDEINVANFNYRVNWIKYKKNIGNEFSNQKADGIYLIVDISLVNVDKEEHTLDNSLFKLTDDSGKEYESSSEGTTALEMNGEKTLFLKQCNPNIQKEGLLCFEVPEKGAYNLHLSGGFWSGTTAVVKLMQ
jgi:hypothetical protein